MRALNFVACAVVVASAVSIGVQSQSRGASGAVVYEGARLIAGDGSPAIENGAFVVQNGHITGIGRQGTVRLPAGAARVDLAGKTVMPAMINAHVHIGYEGYTTWRAENYTAQNVLDHLQREAFYGTAVTQSVGTSPTDAALQFQRDQQGGKFPLASRFMFMPGMAPPDGGPDAVLRVATTQLRVINEVSTADEARAAVAGMAGKGIKSVKIWVDDRRGSYPKMTPEVYNAIIDEAHKRRMVVNAHATTLADQKAVVRAGADVLVHMVQGERLDDEYLALLKERKPYWATVIGLGDPTAVCEHDPFFEQALPASVVAKIRATTERRPLAPSCGPPSPNAANREAIMAYNFPRMIESGARIVLGTDTGIQPGHTFGSGEHVELARWVQLGLTPSQAIVAATSRPAELLGLSDLGTLAVGKRASFIVLDANPLENIRNTRQISSVYLDGVKFDRAAMLNQWQKPSSDAAARPVPAAPLKIAFARVFPNAGQLGLFVANADGGAEHPLLSAPDLDYDPAWSPDGASIIFTSDRAGSADLYRVKADGSGLERLTDNAAYDDQAAFSPDGRQLVFVTTRAGGTSDLWTLDLETRQTKPLTSGTGGDFRPAWSPDGRWIAFSSDRGSGLPFAHGRWEHLHLVDLYLIHPDGTGLERITEHGNACGSPKWSADSRRVIAYCMTAEETLTNRQGRPDQGDDRLVSIDIATRAITAVPAPTGIKIGPVFLPSGDTAYIRKNIASAGIYYGSGRTGPKGDVRSASWSPDGSRVVFHRRLTAPPVTWRRTFSRNPTYEMTLTGILPSFSPSGDRFTFVGRPAVGERLGSSIAVAATGEDKPTVIFHRADTNVLAPQWSPRGDRIIFSIGRFQAFYNGFHSLFLNPPDRVDGSAQIAVINPDGTGYREVTTGPNNNGFPSMAPDGLRVVYRSFGPEGSGLRIMNIETKVSTVLTKGYDNFPLWSPRGDLIMFTRQDQGDYEIYTVKPDGTGARRLTFSPGNDTHQAWSPDGEQIAFASSRLGFKDEALMTDAPQPYGELFVMRYDGTHVEQLTDNQWEDGTPAFQPGPRRLSSR